MTATDTMLALPGLNMHVRDWGGEGRAVVLLHGLASNARIWDLVAPLLAQLGCRVVAIDQRGHGRTGKPPDGYDFPTITADLEASIRQIQIEHPVMVGHSWGASVALNYAATRRGDVSGAVLVDGGIFDMSSRMTWEEAEVQMAPPDLTRLTAERFIERARSWGNALTWDEATTGAVMGNFHTAHDGTIRPHLSRENHMKILRALYDQRPQELFARVTCPVLIAPAGAVASAGFLDRKREAVDRAVSSLPRATARWFDDSVHDIPLHRPRELAEAIGEFAESL